MLNFFDRLLGKKKRVIAPLRDVAGLLAPLAIPAVQVDKTDLPSLSYFGGSPHLPVESSWPERNGKKLAFLARLSLSEIHQACPISWLPSSGALLFFYDMVNQPWGYDPKDRGSSAVLLVPDLPEPTEQTQSRSDQDDSPLSQRNIAFRRIQVLPDPERAAVRELQLTDGEFNAVLELEDDTFQAKPRHQVSGFPSPIQSDSMELECQLVTHGLNCGDSSGYNDPRAKDLEGGAVGWRLLFQFDSDDDLGIMWGDLGRIYFWAEERRARTGDFSNTWVILQCC